MSALDYILTTLCFYGDKMITFIIGFITGLCLGAALQRYLPQIQELKAPKDDDHNTSDDWCWCNPDVETLDNGNKIIKHRDVTAAHNVNHRGG